MKTGTIILVSGLLLATQSYGQDRGYVKVDMGGNVTEDIELKEFFGPVTPGSKIKLNAGYRGGVAGGYWFTDWLAAEGEFGIYANSIDSITDATHLHDSWFENLPFMANLKLRLPGNSPVKPYIGGGAGGTISILGLDHVELNGTEVHGSDSTVVFAWQAVGGIDFRINRQMSVAVEYHYLWADQASWEAEDTFGTASDKIKIGEAHSHALSLVFNYHF